MSLTDFEYGKIKALVLDRYSTDILNLGIGNGIGSESDESLCPCLIQSYIKTGAMKR